MVYVFEFAVFSFERGAPTRVVKGGMRVKLAQVADALVAAGGKRGGELALWAKGIF